jgi:hypothetical protein
MQNKCQEKNAREVEKVATIFQDGILLCASLNSSASSADTAKPEIQSLEATTLKLTRPSGSGNLGLHPTRHFFSGFALKNASVF